MSYCDVTFFDLCLQRKPFVMDEELYRTCCACLICLIALLVSGQTLHLVMLVVGITIWKLAISVAILIALQLWT